MKSTGRTLWRSSACSSRSLLAWSAPYRHARPARRKSRRAKHRQATLQARTHQCTLCKRCHKTIRHQRAPSRARLLGRDLSLTPTNDDYVLQSQVHAGYAQGSNVPVSFVQAIPQNNHAPVGSATVENTVPLAQTVTQLSSW